MKSLLIIASFPLLLNTISFQTPPDTLWTKVFGNGWEGGGCYGGDVGTSVLETSDGGFAITGWIANSDEDSDLWILRTNEIGDTLWTRTYTGEFADDAGYCIQKVENGFMVVGDKETHPGGPCGCSKISKGWLLHLDENGDTLWTKTYLNEGEYLEVSLKCIKKIAQGGFMISGTYENRPFMMRVNEYGDTLWQKNFEEVGSEGWLIEEASNGDWFMVSEGGNQVWLSKIGVNGNIIWERTFRDTIGSWSKSLQSTNDGGCIIAGNSFFQEYTSNLFLTKVNQNGDIVWDRNYILEGNQEVDCLRKLTDGGYIVAGNSEINGNKDALLMRFNEEGSVQWMKTLGGEYDDFAYAVEQTTDNGYIVTGGTCPDSNQIPDLWLIKLAPDQTIPVELSSFTVTTQVGKVILNWTTATETNNLGFEIERKILNNPNLGDWVTIGFREGYGTTTEPKEYSYTDDVCTVEASSFAYRLKQIDFDGSYEYSDEVLVDNPSPVDFALHQNYPNPFNPSTTISYNLPIKSQVELVVYNALGESVIQLVNEVKEAGSYSFELNAESLPSGVYFYRIQAGNFVQVKKMILMK